MTKTHSIIILCILFSLTCITDALGLAPPKTREEINLKADIIVYGQVEKIVADNEDPYFELAIGQVIKGVGKLSSKTDRLRIFCRFDAPPQKDTIKPVKHTQGSLVLKLRSTIKSLPI